MHRKAPSQADPRGSCRVLENHAKQGLGEQKREKAELLSSRTVALIRQWARGTKRDAHRSPGAQRAVMQATLLAQTTA